MRPIKESRHRSHREHRDRDLIMELVAAKLRDRRLRNSEIMVSNREIRREVRASICRGEFEQFSLTRAYLLADACGIDIEMKVSA